MSLEQRLAHPPVWKVNRFHYEKEDESGRGREGLAEKWVKGKVHRVWRILGLTTDRKPTTIRLLHLEVRGNDYLVKDVNSTQGIGVGGANLARKRPAFGSW